MQELEGTVVSGAERAQELISKPGYRVQLRRMLGIDIFPGTLNLEVDEEERESFLAQIRGFEITGFSEEENEFGMLFVYPVFFENGQKGGVIVPEKAEHGSEIIEIVAADNLRKKFGLSDGSSFRIFAGDYVYPEKT